MGGLLREGRPVRHITRGGTRLAAGSDDGPRSDARLARCDHRPCRPGCRMRSLCRVTWRDRGGPGWQSLDPTQRAWTWRGASECLLPTTLIEIGRYSGPLYLCHGGQDSVWAVAMTSRLEKRLRGAAVVPRCFIFPARTIASIAMRRTSIILASWTSCDGAWHRHPHDRLVRKRI